MRIIKGALSGIIIGALAGGALGGNALLNAYSGLGTFWPACGPHIFVPMWICAVVGTLSKITGESFTGLLLLMASGIVAGLAAPVMFQNVFGQPYSIGSAFMGIRYAQEIALSGGGIVAALFWYFGINKLFR